MRTTTLFLVLFARIGLAQIHVNSNPTLNQALLLAQIDDWIIIHEGQYLLDEYYQLPAGLRLEASGTEHVTIQAAPGQRHFKLTGALEISMHRITFTGGSGVPSGGAFLLENSSLFLEDVSFESNGSEQTEQGGALACELSTLVLADCFFQQNRAFSRGGAIYLRDSNSIIEDCQFESNTILDPLNLGIEFFGGALHANGGTFGAFRCGFISNQVMSGFAGSGGALELSRLDDVTSLEDCRFENNSAGFGGALYASYLSGDLLITRSGSSAAEALFTYNTALHGGGAIFLKNANTLLERVNIDWNTVSDGPGGGLAVVRRFTEEEQDFTVQVRLESCQINSNSAAYFGGGISSGGCSSVGLDLELVDTQIEGNEVLFAGGVDRYSFGGGAAIIKTNLHIYNCRFLGNILRGQASYQHGAGLGIMGSRAHLVGSVFTGNSIKGPGQRLLGGGVGILPYPHQLPLFFKSGEGVHFCEGAHAHVEIDSCWIADNRAVSRSKCNSGETLGFEA